MARRAVAHLGILAVLALLASACGSGVAGGGSGGGGSDGGASDECPLSLPAEWSACSSPGLHCRWDAASECTELHDDADCTPDGWSVTHTQVCPDHPYGCTFGGCLFCPPAPPMAGEPCTGPYYDAPCTYAVETPCGPVMTTAICADGLWSLPASTCPACTTNTTSETCLADLACRWIAPGCDPSPAPLGCFPKDDCVLGALCDDGQVCTAYGADPCWAGNCNACNAPVQLCLTPPS